MFLSDVDIEKAVRKGHIVLKPFDKKRLQPVSYDIRLGNKFIANDENATHFVDPVRKIYAKTREAEVKDGQEFVLHPGISVLGTSKEYFGSDDYLIQIGGKSSLARIGLMVHNTAGIINPGHFLHVTFEMTNQSNVPIILRPGMEIAQLTFSTLSSPPRQNYSRTGRFVKDNWKHFVPAKSTAKRKTSKKKTR
ncbi:dCTP deaminase [Candidatus Kaiserbacteria bacterium RIFCSPHIGHO2_12_FULL_53_13]|uniref:dCTP deaminase n=1 Tax=Candidatus Kaiserbacteria bacterium RIFCSPHIGHO2_12_FULL_53_13 TaxID=1798502 RepID=A0A1F6EC15_9BACT|nr:MAG: dCTP deaminase [Candidatus Kaiserbacteria bacterium RIFCSPHIGHO2_12_FULL_53_13]